MDGELKNKHGAALMQSFDYFDTFKRLVARINKERICILLLEDLERNPEAFYAKLGDFVGEDLNYLAKEKLEKENFPTKDYWVRSPILVKIKRTLRPIIRMLPYSVREKINRPFLEKLKMNEKTREEIMAVYKEGNELLARDFGLDLKKYGYY